MAVQINIFLLATSLTLFSCNDDLSTDSNPDKLSDEDLIWLEDSDSNGIADSIEVYAPDCTNKEDCLEEAKGNKIHFTPPGGTYNEEIQIKITAAGDGIIRVTTNGDNPSEESEVFTDPIKITATTELRARKFLEGSDAAGPIQSALYEFKVNTPTATKKSGEYKDPIKIAIDCETGKVEIFYTSDGSTPSDSSTPYRDSLKILNTTTIKAIAIKEGWSPSDTMEVHYTINNPKAAAPVFSPKGETYTEPQEVSITSETEDAEIRYTLDGEDPDSSSKLYSEKIPVNKGMIIIAVAMKEGLKTSAVSEAEFKINLPEAADPVFTPKEGTYTEPQEVSITSETEDAEIRYTLDGKDPESSSKLYSEKISVDRGMTIKAVAMKEGMNSSPVSEAEFTIILDTLGPFITLLNPSWKDSTVTAADVTIEVRVQDSSGVKSVTINDAAMALSEGKYSQTLTLSAGENKVAVTAEDKSTNQNKSADTLKITYDPPPVPVDLFDPTHITGEGMRIKWSQNDNTDFQAYKIYYSTSPSVTTSGNLAHVELVKQDTVHTFSELTLKNTYYVKVYVFDNTSSTGSNEVSAFLNTAPVFAELAGQSVDENKELSFTISASDADGDSLAYSMLTPPVPDGRPAFDSSTKTFFWNPTYTDSGSYIAKFEATDHAKHPGRDTLAVNITVKHFNGDSLVVRHILDSNGFDSVPVDDNICSYFDERINNLHLDRNRIQGQLTSLPAEIQNLTELIELNLDSNKLTSLPSSIGNLTKLNQLSVWGNNLTSLPAEIGSLINLTLLWIDNNQLSSLPSGFGNLINLTHLSFENNQLSSLPSDFGNLINLTYLSIDNNQLSSLPSGIGNLTKLDLLSVWGNKLTSLPVEIGNLTNLTRLLIGNNQLGSLPSGIGNLTKLERLSIWDNELTSLPAEFGNLVNLTEISFWNNQLSSLPSEIVNLTKLTGLDVTDNKLCNLSDTVKTWIDTYSSKPDWESTQACGP